eukprot:364906-Chlamydomonas_euryale.AAC.2
MLSHVSCAAILFHKPSCAAMHSSARFCAAMRCHHAVRHSVVHICTMACLVYMPISTHVCPPPPPEGALVHSRVLACSHVRVHACVQPPPYAINDGAVHARMHACMHTPAVIGRQYSTVHA